MMLLLLEQRRSVRNVFQAISEDISRAGRALSRLRGPQNFADPLGWSHFFTR